MRILAATRSPGKLREIRRLLDEALPGVEVISPDEAGCPFDPAEEGIEVFDTFEENALAKARWFHQRTGLATVADDSGLEVDALDGRPGVRSKRFAPAPTDEPGQDEGPEDEGAVSRRNVAHLVRLLQGVPPGERGARFVCVAVYLAAGEDTLRARGEAEGRILEMPRGTGGFGYDPVFLDEATGRSFAELTAEEKSERSHRGRAFAALATALGRTLPISLHRAPSDSLRHQGEGTTPEPSPEAGPSGSGGEG
jgi:XTP/dITP diphosphohydrolase